MRYRKLDANGDYSFGGQGEFHVDTPDTVAQAIQTRLNLWTGEWFADLNEGTDFLGKILGYGTNGTRDLVLVERIVGTPGVKSIVEYASAVDTRERSFTVLTRVDTIYGTANVEMTR